MREDSELEAAKQALDNRLEQFDHPLLTAFNQPKRDVVVGILHGDDDPQEIVDTVDEALRSEMKLPTFIQAQAAKNAAQWCAGEHDSI